MPENNEKQALSWDEGFEAAGGRGSAQLAPGPARFAIESVKKDRFEGSSKMEACPVAILELTVTDQNGATATVHDRLHLNKVVAWKLTEFAKCIGAADRSLPEGATFRIPWNDLAGREGYCKIERRTWTGDDGNERQSNSVAEYLFGEAAEKARAQVG